MDYYINQDTPKNVYKKINDYMNSISNTDRYKLACLKAVENEENFSTFKRNPDYTEILEHVTQIQGEIYLDYIRQNSTEIFEMIPVFKSNDIYGGAKKFNFNNIGDISPTTLRYIKVLCDIKDKIGNIKGKKIVEIGAGYGGQCLILKKFFGQMDYSIIDLDESSSLCLKYLKKNGIDVNIIDMQNLDSLNEEFDLVISNYAYSELDKELQDLYYKYLIQKTKNGYFTFNFISEYWHIDSYSEKEIFTKFSEKKFEILEENPKTFENNIILFWSEKN